MSDVNWWRIKGILLMIPLIPWLAESWTYTGLVYFEAVVPNSRAVMFTPPGTPPPLPLPTTPTRRLVCESSLRKPDGEYVYGQKFPSFLGPQANTRGQKLVRKKKRLCVVCAFTWLCVVAAGSHSTHTWLLRDPIVHTSGCCGIPYYTHMVVEGSHSTHTWLLWDPIVHTHGCWGIPQYTHMVVAGSHSTHIWLRHHRPVRVGLHCHAKRDHHWRRQCSR